MVPEVTNEALRSTLADLTQAALMALDAEQGEDSTLEDLPPHLRTLSAAAVAAMDLLLPLPPGYDPERATGPDYNLHHRDVEDRSTDLWPVADEARADRDASDEEHGS